MKKAIKILFLVSLGVFLFPSTGLSQQFAMANGNPSAFFGKARNQNKPTMVYFTKPGCAPCMRMKKISFNNEQLKSLLSTKVLAYEADGESFDGFELAQKYEVKVYPTIVFIDSKGKVVGKLYGYQSADKLIYLINKYL